MNKDRFKTSASLVWHFLKGSKRYFVLAVSFAMLVSFLDLVNPKIIGYTVDTIIGNSPSTMPTIFNNLVDKLGGIAHLKTHIWILAIMIVVVALLSAICRFLFRLNNAMGAETLVKTMRDELFDQILHLPFKWHSENHTGDIIQRCTSDVDQIKMFLSEQLTSLFRVIVLIILSLFFMLQISVKLTLVTAIFFPIVIGYSFFFHNKIGSQFEKADSEEGRLSAIAQENLTGIRVVRAFGRETYERERFEKQNRDYTNLWIKLMHYLSLFWSTGDIFSHSQIIVIMAFGVSLAVKGEITVGNYIAFIYYNGMLTWPVRMLGRVIANMSKAGISIERLRYIMNSEREVEKENTVKPDLRQDISFKNVSYKYENGNREVLDNVSLDIKAGSTVGILGSTGSGKSTLMYLLDRLYDLSEGSGSITIGDTNINDIDRAYLRTNIGMVLQEPYLFSRTLEENIKIAKDGATFSDVEEATRVACLTETINNFKQGYETTVGERGVTLSGGQKQRTAIAQMLIRKPPIMIFDDSLSAVDSETDAKIRNALKDSVGEATVIIIAHRITTLMHADKIVVMDKGKIIEEGNHEELMKIDGVYKKIHDLQLEQGKIEEEEEDGK